MAGYQAVHTGGPIKRRKKVASHSDEPISTPGQGMLGQPKPSKRTAQIGQMTTDFYNKGVGGGKNINRSFTEINRTKNKRAGQAFRTEIDSKGNETHIYKSGERVFVKKKAKKNPPRKLF